MASLWFCILSPNPGLHLFVPHPTASDCSQRAACYTLLHPLPSLHSSCPPFLLSSLSALSSPLASWLSPHLLALISALPSAPPPSLTAPAPPKPCQSDEMTCTRSEQGLIVSSDVASSSLQIISLVWESLTAPTPPKGLPKRRGVPRRGRRRVRAAVRPRAAPDVPDAFPRSEGPRAALKR